MKQVFTTFTALLSIILSSTSFAQARLTKDQCVRYVNPDGRGRITIFDSDGNDIWTQVSTLSSANELTENAKTDLIPGTCSSIVTTYVLSGLTQNLYAESKLTNNQCVRFISTYWLSIFDISGNSLWSGSSSTGDTTILYQRAKAALIPGKCLSFVTYDLSGLIRNLYAE